MIKNKQKLKGCPFWGILFYRFSAVILPALIFRIDEIL
ncbi:hypothetical protein CHCC14820_2458 [Bacillus paralicheniformis]|nr:hypothetical protein B4123_4605 [Bacillus paralicheniformis]TWJ60805.1 hypothetical protein CHCC5023_0922 [Bacillus paralicheniformis]TWJ61144.1 hypothetical protein CHCC5021_3900 [Bacillus paralicheniformis]TWJ77951.1 hypothetical protein CHCC5019_1072 [Bacillus paralicheniformis]TWL05163.1 hypothetical protein CHCC19468_3884 [Bacillus paralicheniformis]